jgi:hypothetical protein
MKPGKQIGTIDRAITVRITRIDKTDRPAPIEAPHQGDLPLA